MHSLLHQRQWNEKVLTLLKILFPDPPHKSLGVSISFPLMHSRDVTAPISWTCRRDVKTPMLVKGIPCTTRPVVPFHVLV